MMIHSVNCIYHGCVEAVVVAAVGGGDDDAVVAAADAVVDVVEMSVNVGDCLLMRNFLILIALHLDYSSPWDS